MEQAEMIKEPTLAGIDIAPDSPFPAISHAHHVAYRSNDAEATRHFYEDILGLPLVCVLRFPPNAAGFGIPHPFVHIFFRMASGACIAFFDFGDNRPVQFDAPSWCNHIAMQVKDEAALQEAWHRLNEAGVKVDYLRDHGFCRSIYMYDPSGNRVELTTPTPNEDAVWAHEKAEAKTVLAQWLAERPGINRPA